MIDMQSADAQEWKRVGIINARGGTGEWRNEGLCAETDPDAFFPDQSQAWEGLRAKATCKRCYVIAECLTYALIADEPFGVWGGRSFNERKRMPRPTVEAYLNGEVVPAEGGKADGAPSIAVSDGRGARALEVVRLHKAGANARQIGEAVGINPRSVARIVRRLAAQAQPTEGAA